MGEDIGYRPIVNTLGRNCLQIVKIVCISASYAVCLRTMKKTDTKRRAYKRAGDRRSVIIGYRVSEPVADSLRARVQAGESIHDAARRVMEQSLQQKGCVA